MNSDTSSPAQREQRHLFLGREGELQWLQDAWQATLEDGPQMRILTAESGYGKTKIAQAFYSWLSTKCDPEDYWPDNLLQEGKDLRVMPDMAGIQPTGKIPWLWWGLRWENLEGRNIASHTSPFLNLRADPAFIAHENALLIHFRTNQACIKAFFSAGKATLSLVPGADLVSNVVQAASDIGEAVAIANEHRSQSRASAIDVSTEKAIQETLDFFALLLDPEKGDKTSLPVVLLLDDVQWIDPLSLEIVRRLWTLAAKRGFPLLVFATHWQQEWNKGFCDTQSGDSFARWVWELNSTAQASQSPEKIHVRKLGKLKEVRELLETEFPGLAVEQVDHLCGEVDGNPRHMSEIIELLKENDIWFECEDLTKALNRNWENNLANEKLDLPNLERRRFKSIEKHLKKLLGTASLQGDRFLQVFTLEVAKKLGFEPNQSSENITDNPLKAAENPHDLAEAIDELSMEFRSTNIRKCAEEYLEQSSDLDRDTVEKKVVETALDWAKSKKIDELPLVPRLRILDCVSQLADKMHDRSEQTLFHATALQAIQKSGDIFFASRWIDSWVELSPKAEELSICDFWMLLDVAEVLFVCDKISDAINIINFLKGRITQECGDKPLNSADESIVELAGHVLDLEGRSYLVLGDPNRSKKCFELAFKFREEHSKRAEKSRNDTKFKKAFFNHQQTIINFAPAAKDALDKLLCYHIGLVRLDAYEEVVGCDKIYNDVYALSYFHYKTIVHREIADLLSSDELKLAPGDDFGTPAKHASESLDALRCLVEYVNGVYQKSKYDNLRGIIFNYENQLLIKLAALARSERAANDFANSIKHYEEISALALKMIKENYRDSFQLRSFIMEAQQGIAFAKRDSIIRGDNFFSLSESLEHLVRALDLCDETGRIFGVTDELKKDAEILIKSALKEIKKLEQIQFFEEEITRISKESGLPVDLIKSLDPMGSRTSETKQPSFMTALINSNISLAKVFYRVFNDIDNSIKYADQARKFINIMGKDHGFSDDCVSLTKKCNTLVAEIDSKK